MSLNEITAGRDIASLAALVKAADRDSTACRARIARNDQIKAACQLELIRMQLEATPPEARPLPDMRAAVARADARAQERQERAVHVE